MVEIPVDATAGFEQFVRRRADALWRAAWLLTGDSGKAEDLVQTALAKTWSRDPQFDNDNHFEAYVRTTVYRTFVSWWRRAQWRAEISVDDVGERAVDDSAIGPEVRLDLARAMGQLTRIQRAVIVLRFYEDMTVAQVAEALGMPANTVKTHSRRAFAKIRESVHLDIPEE